MGIKTNESIKKTFRSYRLTRTRIGTILNLSLGRLASQIVDEFG